MQQGVFFVTVVVLIWLPYSQILGFDLLLLAEALCLGIWIMGLDLLVGYAGLVSFGQAAWFGLGGYFAGVLLKDHLWDLLTALVVTVAVVGILAVVIGTLVTRVGGIAFAILTLAIGEVVYVVIARVSSEGGAVGISAVPFPKVAGQDVLFTNESLYLLILITAIVSYLLALLFVRSPAGRMLQATRDNATRARFLGVEVRRYQVLAFVAAAMFSAVSGCMFVVLKGGVGLTQFAWTTSGEALIILIVGGAATLYGSYIGAIVFVFGSSYLSADLPESWRLYFGIVFVVLVLVAPRGLAGIPGYVLQLGRMALSWRRS